MEGLRKTSTSYWMQLNLALPACWAGAYAGGLRSNDREAVDHSRRTETQGEGRIASVRFRKQYFLIAGLVLFVSTVLWLTFTRMRRWW